MTHEPNSLGTVETKYYNPPHKVKLECGEILDSITIAYETYGTLNEDKSNAILVVHALSGDAHAAGVHKGEAHPGWWDDTIGPDKAFDTNQYFVICSNVLGGCKGTTGPSSINPQTQKPYALNFPLATIKDMVNVQKLLIDHLGIDKLLSVAGGSMGGMQVLQWLVSYPEKVRSAIPIATTPKHSPQQIAFNEVGRQAIMADHSWNDGNYYEGHPPTKGLAIARMVGHITYMSEQSMIEKFGRKLKDEKEPFKFTAEFEVEGYLRYKGDSFVKRFDANSYLYITKAIDYFDLAQDQPLNKIFKGIKAKLLVIAFTSDWLYSIQQSREIVKACKQGGVDVTYCEIPSTYGHDAFLLEFKEESHLIKHFLRKLK